MGIKEIQKKWRKIFLGSIITIPQTEKKKKSACVCVEGGQVSFEVHIVMKLVALRET